MNTVQEIQKKLRNAVTVSSENQKRFFKAKPGQYVAHDQFLGVTVPTIRSIAKLYPYITLDDIMQLLQLPYNEERLCALIMLVEQYKKTDQAQRKLIYELYLTHKNKVNNWNLVDSSAHLIVGFHLFDKDRSILYELARSQNLWDRRIAMVATWYFIRKGNASTTLIIAEMLLQDDQDLMHKAVGWMLREAGKKDQVALINFLEQYKNVMPRTMLRYAIEKFSDDERNRYLGNRSICSAS